MAALKNMKQEAFAVAFTDLQADTFGNGEKSAVAARYSENSARTQAWRLLKNDDVNRRILELYDETLKGNRVTTESVLANLAHDRSMARKEGQYSVAVRCTELEGKYLSLFTDRLNISDPKLEAAKEAQDKEQTELITAFAHWYTGQLAMGKDPRETIKALEGSATAEPCSPEEPDKRTIPFKRPVEQPPVDEPKAG